MNGLVNGLEILGNFTFGYVVFACVHRQKRHVCAKLLERFCEGVDRDNLAIFQRIRKFFTELQYFHPTNFDLSTLGKNRFKLLKTATLETLKVV